MNTIRDGLARSVLVRLSLHAKSIRVDPNLILSRYAVERFLYRLSRSSYADRFVLKGALLMLVWLGDTHRPTRDADLLGFGDLSHDMLLHIFSSICTVEVEPDAVTYHAESIRIEPIRIEDSYGGQRVTLSSTLGAARLRVQVDVGVGDAVVPSPEWLEYPSLLNLPRPRLRAYSVESVIAEKLHAIVTLGLRNSRLKDYFDLHALAVQGAVENLRIANAIEATFNRRRTEVPNGLPPGLSDEFARDSMKRRAWSAFLERNRLEAPPLEVVVDAIRMLVAEPMVLARQRKL